MTNKYFCSNCNRNHYHTSKIGKKHSMIIGTFLLRKFTSNNSQNIVKDMVKQDKNTNEI